MVCTSDSAVTSSTPILIGTSMLVRPARSADAAERKNGMPAYATVGMATNADTQCSRVRVVGPMSCHNPAQTAMDSIITFMAANPATANARSRRRKVASCTLARAAAS